MPKSGGGGSEGTKKKKTKHCIKLRNGAIQRGEWWSAQNFAIGHEF